MAKQKRLAPPWQLILETIESETRLAIEAVNTRADQLERKLDAGFDKIDARFDVIEAVMRENGNTIRELRRT
jgi:hypothetical protein